MYARLPDGKESLFQWDTKQYLEVSQDVTRIDFCFRVDPDTVYGVFAKDGICYIPNLLIQKAGIVDALIMSTEIGVTTDRRLEIPVIERPIPPGYVATKDGAIIAYDDLEDILGEMDFLKTSGGTMTGDIDMDGRSVTGLVDPVEDGDAVRKRYVDKNFFSHKDGEDFKSKVSESFSEEQQKVQNTLNAFGEDVEKKQTKPQKFSSVSVDSTAWQTAAASSCDGVRTKYANVTLAGVTADMVPQVVFWPVDIEAWNLSPVVKAIDGGIQIYAETAPTNAITIGSILCWG